MSSVHKKSLRRKLAEITLPLFGFLALMPWMNSMDMAASDYGYNAPWISRAGNEGFGSTSAFDFLYLWGVVPGQVLVISSLTAYFLSFMVKRLAQFRKAYLYVVCVLIIGAGLITHAIFKHSWARPRPKQVIFYGGTHPFHPIYTPSLCTTEHLRSLPSGHATMGFYFFCLYFLGRRYSLHFLTQVGIYTGLGLGIILSIARIFQGGHFVSDTLLSALIMWESCAILDYMFWGTNRGIHHAELSHIGIDDAGANEKTTDRLEGN